MSQLGGAEALALLLVLFTLVTLLFFLARVRRRRVPYVRPLAAFDRIPPELGKAAEAGHSLHVALGSGGIGGERTVTSLAGLQVLEGVADAAVAYAASPVVTVGDPTLLLLAQDILRRASERVGLPERYDPAMVRFVTTDPLVYGLGASDFVRHERVMGSVLAGAFGEEAALITYGGETRGLTQMAAADHLRALGALYPSSAFLAVGEELYAAGARLTRLPRYLAGLRTQDVLRFVLVALLLLKALGVF